MKMALNLLVFMLVFLAAADNAAAQIRRGIPPCSGRFGDCGYDRDPYYGYGYYGGYGRPADPQAERVRRSGRAAKDQAQAYKTCLEASKKRYPEAPPTEVMDRCMLVAKPDEPGTAEGADKNKSVLFQNLQRSPVATKR